MIRSLELFAIAIIVSAVLADRPVMKVKGGSVKPMDQEVQLTWNAAGDHFEGRQQVYFMYSPAQGLSDIDFHSITAREWKVMKAPTGDAVARLQVVKETTLDQVDEVVRQISEKGGYKTVVVMVRR